MADNQIKISVNLDSKEFDQNFKRIMNQVNQLRQATGNVPGLTASGASASSKIGGANQTVNAQQSDRSLQGLQKTLEGLTGRTDTFNKSLSALSKTLDDLSNKAQQAATATTQAATAQQAVGGVGGGGGAGTTPPGGAPIPGGPGGTLGQILSATKVLSTVGSAISAVGAATKFGGQLYGQMATYPNRIAQRESTMAGMMSESARLQQQRRGYEMSLFGPERARALTGASQAVKAAKAEDMSSLVGGTLGGAGAGMVGGAVIGGALGLGLGTVLAPFTGGASIPLFGAAGAKIGAGYGTALGGATAFGSQMTNDRKRSMLFDQESYQKEMGAVFAGNYKERLSAEKAKSYQKDLAAQFMEKESDRFSTLQRGFGLSDKELFMGDQSIFRRLTGPDQRYEMGDITQAMQGISAAGGTKGIATGQGLETSLQMQRNLGLTNAPQLMGKVSGVTGMGAEGSREQIFRMFAEASRAKLELPEARQFMDTATGIGYRTGGDLDTITQSLSAGVQGTGLQSARGIEAAQSAFEQFRQKTGETGGLTGQYKLSGLFSKGLDLEQAAYISNLPIDQISENNPVVARIAKEKGISIGELKKEMTKSTFRTGATEEAATAYGESKKQFESMEPGQEGYEKAKKDMEEKRHKFALKRNVENLLPQNQLEAQALMDIEAASVTGDKEGVEKAQDKLEKIKKQYGEAPTGLAEEAKKDRARGDESGLYNLEEQAKALSKAFSDQEGLTVAARSSAEGIAHLGKILKEIKDEKILEDVKKNLEEIAKMGPKGPSDSKQPPQTGAVAADGVKSGPQGSKK
jgi:hypothetical protein